MAIQKFPKSSRLLTRADFARLKGDSFRIGRPFLSAWIKMYPRSRMRLGISVSKKVGNAVRRNRLKRIIREIFRRSSCRQLGCDVLIVVNPELPKNIPESPKADEQVKKSFKAILRDMERKYA